MIQYIIGILVIAGIIILIVSWNSGKKFKKKKKEYLEQAKIEAAKAYLTPEIKAISRNFIKELRGNTEEFIPNAYAFEMKEDFIDTYVKATKNEKQRYTQSNTFIMFYKVLDKKMNFESEHRGLYMCWFLLQYASIEYYGDLFIKRHPEITATMNDLDLKHSIKHYLKNIHILKKGEYYGATDSFGQSEPVAIPKKLIYIFVFFLLKTEKFQNEQNFDIKYAEKTVYSLLQEIQEELEIEFAEQRLSKS